MGEIILGFESARSRLEIELVSARTPKSRAAFRGLHAALVREQTLHPDSSVTLELRALGPRLVFDWGRITVPRMTRRMRVRPAPGYRLLAFAELLFSRTACENVLVPTVEDMRDEYNAALAAGRSRKAMLVRVRGTGAFLKAAGLLKALSVVKTVVRMWSSI